VKAVKVEPANGPFPRLVRLAGIAIVARLVQTENAPSPIVVVFPRPTLTRLEQLMNAEAPMLWTLAGVVTLVRSVQKSKAYGPIEVTEEGIVKVPPTPAGNATISVPALLYRAGLMALYDALVGSTPIEVRPVQSSNASVPMAVTLAGSTMPVRCSQLMNAKAPI
jgi:hypothetical protein